MRYKCIVSYDGYDYKGFQIQEDEPTIELSLKKAIFSMINQEVKIYASGRTDSKVHAKGQVFHFDTTLDIPTYAIKNGLNTRLESSIQILEVEKVSEDFHARFSATRKEYHYLVKITKPTVFESRYMTYYPNLDLDLLQKGLDILKGKHNFRGFCSAQVHPQKDFIKEIFEAKVIKDDDILTFVFIGSGFLKYQIRRMMGLLLEVGSHKQSLEMIQTVLISQDPKISHKIAPGYGLYLERVFYNE